MTYREKFAWLSLAAMAIAFGPYFALVALGPFAGDAMPFAEANALMRRRKA